MGYVRRGAVATIVIALLLSLTSACSSRDGASGAADVTAADDEAAIQKLFADYSSAFDKGEFAEICAMNTDQFNEELVTEFREAIGDDTATCPQAIEVTAAEGPADLALRDIRVSESPPTSWPCSSTAFCPPTSTVVAPGGMMATWLKAGLWTSPSGRNTWISDMTQT